MAVTTDFTEELYKPQSGIALFTLVEISHSNFDDTLYLVDNTESIDYGGDTYSPMALKFDIPNDTEELTNDTTLTIDNVDRSTILQLRKVSTTVKPTITISIVSDIGGTVQLERGPFPFQLNNISYDLYAIKLTIAYNDELQYNFPTITMTPDNCPGIF